MDLPQPPADQELKNIIDKLAQFVARNGPEFEHMTKQKQKDNPKFSFLFGGTFFYYYQYRVTTEQAILKQKQRSLEQQAIVQQAINRQSIQTAPWQQHLHQIQDTSQEQIRQSEQNLAAQHQLLLQQQQVQVDEIIRKAQEEKMAKLAQENELDLKELDGVLQPIIDSCTKDSISTGKGWIFSHATSPAHSEVIVMYILKKVTEPGATFEAKLHLVYLINDVLHHCIRKNADDLKKVLERVVVPIFCSTSIGVDADKQQKLSKLHKLWETNKYFEQNILDQLQNPAASLAAYQAGLIAEYAALITPITTAIQAQYSLLQKQHQDFVAHLTGQMHQMQMPVPYAFQSPQNVMMPAQQPMTTPYIHPPRPPFEPQNLPPAPQTPDMSRIQPHVQIPDEIPKQAVVDYPQVHQTDPIDVQHKENESTVEPEVPQTDDIQPEIKNSDVHSQDPEASSSSGTMAHEYPPPDMCETGYGHPDMHPNRHPNGRPMGPSNYMDDYSPHYGRGPPPAFGPEHPEYNITPPHISSYGRRMPFRDGPITTSESSGVYIELSQEVPQHSRSCPVRPGQQRKSMEVVQLKGGHHDIPPDYMEPPLPPPCSPPYYDLPAGLMVPLVRALSHRTPSGGATDRILHQLHHHELSRHCWFRYVTVLHENFSTSYLEDTDYDKPLDPDDVHLPPPALPTERLLAAVEQFYCPPTHERTRNNSYVISSEGWEQLGLYEFFKAKAQAKKQKSTSEDRNYNASNDSCSLQGFPEKKDEKRRRYREFKSPDPESSGPVRNGSKGKRHSRSLSRSRSRSPEPSPRRSSRSPSPRPHFSRSRRRSRSRSPPDKSRSPDRSSSPPYMGAGSNSHDRRLDESNKGHQLLRKMGWGGAGLGATEQGIQDPVDAGDVRDRQDMYKGIGSNLNDPYENFRKSKGQAFINRMKARAEELGKI